MEPTKDDGIKVLTEKDISVVVGGGSTIKRVPLTKEQWQVWNKIINTPE